MGRDMRSVKFEMFIKEILETMGKEFMIGKPEQVIKQRMSLQLSIFGNSQYCYRIEDGAWLALIYDYSKLNEYGKIIMETVCNFNTEDSDGEIRLLKKYEDAEYRIKEARRFIEEFNMFLPIDNYRRKELKCAFIFWALMILTVDDTDKEKHLSLICDFARMLKLTDEDVEDMVQMICLIYHKAEGECRFNNSFKRDPLKSGINLRALLDKYTYSAVKIVDKNGKNLNEGEDVEIDL